MDKRAIAMVAAGLAGVAALSLPSAASASAQGTKELRVRAGLTLRIPTTWKVYTVDKDWTRVVTGACPTAGTSRFGFRDSGCRSFWVMGPEAIKVGHEHFDAYTPDEPFYPANDVGPCPYDKKLWLGPMTLADKGLAQVGRGHKAYYRAWSARCVSPKTYKNKARFTQREWFLPTSKILFVDQWNTPGLSAILKQATWS
ncbi:hypothetical protein [Microtetraspora fusca]|uniref:Uncharacterized protein n=1 Tax=Microtetraspora fusca TaxID=1997 RepID=A0ABW6VJM8_MICFU|nr:hypothetical protein [Microtetraspora fusca]